MRSNSKSARHKWNSPIFSSIPTRPVISAHRFFRFFPCSRRDPSGMFFAWKLSHDWNFPVWVATKSQTLQLITEKVQIFAYLRCQYANCFQSPDSNRYYATKSKTIRNNHQSEPEITSKPLAFIAKIIDIHKSNIRISRALRIGSWAPLIKLFRAERNYCANLWVILARHRENSYIFPRGSK